MSSDLSNRPRRDFGELAKLARTPANGVPAEREEGSGMIHLASLVAPAGGVPPASGILEIAEREPRTPEAAAPDTQVIAVPRLADWARSALVLASIGGALVIGGIAGSLGTQGMRPIADGSRAAPAERPASPKPAEVAAPRPEPPADLSLAPATALAPDLPVTISPAIAAPSSEPPPPRVALPVPAPAPSVEPKSQPARGEDKPKTVAQSTLSLADEIRQAAGGAPPATEAATSESAAPTNPGGIVPEHPSLGAINSALARALREAQACVTGDVPISRATVTFGSAGTVEAVTVRGWAAGKPAEACIQGALKKPRVAPFLRPSYAVPVTIRSD